MKNFVTKTSDTAVSKTLKFPIGKRPQSWIIRLKQMTGATASIIERTEISSITQTEFNDGNVTFIINVAHIGRKNNQLFQLYRANLIFKIKKDGTMQMVRNGRLVTVSTEIEMFLHFFYRIGVEYSHVFDKLQDKDIGIYDYYFSRNKKLFQLPCDREFLINYYYNSLDNNVRNKVNYHLRKGNTHKAVIALLGYDFPKSIRKLLLKNASYATASKVIKKVLLAGIPIDTVRILLLQDRLNLLELLSKKPTLTGWSIKEKKEKVETDAIGFAVGFVETFSEACARDILRMVTNLYTGEVTIDISNMPNNIRQLHDELIPIYNRMMDERQAESWALMNKFHKSEYDVAMINGYTIRPVVNSNECVTIGNEMSICVGAYADNHCKGLVEILVVTDNTGAYLACLELKEFNLFQAKLKYNRFVSNDKDICDAVIQYCNQFGINISTRDVM